MNSENDTMTVLAAREKYLLESGYSVESYTDPKFRIAIGKLELTFRNPGKVHYHDLHHVVSGYGTGLVGEGEVSAFELRGGYHTFMIWFFCIGAIAIGSVLSPRRLVRAWRRAKGTRNLYDSTIPYDDLLNMKVDELRSLLNIPAGGFR